MYLLIIDVDGLSNNFKQSENCPINGFTSAGILHQYGKFDTACTKNSIRSSNVCRQPLRDNRNHLITGMHTEHVIDFDETVYLDINQCQTPHSFFGLQQKFTHLFRKHGTVRQMRQTVVQGQVANIFFIHLTFRDVRKDEVITGQRAISAMYGIRGYPLGYDGSVLVLPPQLTRPFTAFLQCLPHRLEVNSRISSPTKRRGAMADHLAGGITGDSRECGVDRNDVSLFVSGNGCQR